ncbi:MAG: polymerase subunit beta [Parcubacteria group bacterium]|nr:polymerase subunit beta [Parcubacteria group bacterium]
MEEKIIDYIKNEYNPEVILLGGSRARGRETEKSDWDLFLLGSKKENGGFLDFQGARLDVTFKKWPEENRPLTIPYGPLWPVKVLLDNSDGKLLQVLAKTEEDFGKGPLTLYSEAVSGRFERLDSWRRKLEKYGDNPMVEYFYAGFFYEIAIRLWFEVRNRWPLTPAEAFPLIQSEDKGFYDLLASFMTSNPKERIKFAEVILGNLNVLRKSK